MTVIKRENQNQLGDLWHDPFRGLDTMGNFVRAIIDRAGTESDIGQYPVDIEEDEDSIKIEAELPGFKKEEIDVSLDSGVLTIKAERKQKESNGTNKHLSERRFTRVQRSFTVPNRVDGSQVDARLEDGVLHITLTKKEETKPRKIDVQ